MPELFGDAHRKFLHLHENRVKTAAVGNPLGKPFPGCIQILDFWHAAEHAWKCARTLFGDQTQSTKTWARRLVRTLGKGGVHKVIEELKTLECQVRTKAHKKAVLALRSYYEQHACRMDYPRYRRVGLSIGSGATESVHKQLTHVRMRQAGMRWSILGAQRLIALRLSTYNQPSGDLNRSSAAPPKTEVSHSRFNNHLIL